MRLREFALLALVFGLLVTAFLKCTDSAVNPYHVAPALELPTDTLKGYVGTPLDSLVVDVKNNVEVDEFGISSELPKGISFDASVSFLLICGSICNLFRVSALQRRKSYPKSSVFQSGPRFWGLSGIDNALNSRS